MSSQVRLKEEQAPAGLQTEIALLPAAQPAIVPPGHVTMMRSARLRQRKGVTAKHASASLQMAGDGA